MECVICYRDWKYTVKLCDSDFHVVCIQCYEKMDRKKDTVQCPICRNYIKIKDDRPYIKTQLQYNLYGLRNMYKLKRYLYDKELQIMKQDIKYGFGDVLNQLEDYFNENGKWQSRWDYQQQFQLQFEPVRRIFTHQKKRTESLDYLEHNCRYLDYYIKKRNKSQRPMFQIDYER